MNICTTEQEYIQQIIEPVQRCCARYGYLPSVLMAQSCLENGYGIPNYWDNSSISDLIKNNNMVGLKTALLNNSWVNCGKSVWLGQSFTKRTPEEYNGRTVTITDSFRCYDSIEQSFADYLCFMSFASNYGPGGEPKYGQKVLTIKDPETLIKKVSSLGYATGSTYANSVMRIIKNHGLTKYDDLSSVEPTDCVPECMKETKEVKDLYINRDWITTNNSNSTNDPNYIVIHNTDNYNKGATAKAHAQGLHDGYMQAMSWHYVVDDVSIFQCLEHNRGAWHVGKNYGSNNLFGTVNNRNSICIEMCVNAGFDYEKAFQNTIALTKHLMKQLNIPADRVIQHWDVCTKNCPSEIRKRGDWQRFKMALIGGSVNEGGYTVTFSNVHVGVTGSDAFTCQAMLNAHGVKGKDGQPLKLDGDFGENSEYALKEFQKAHGLTPDGDCGPKTWPVLFGKV